MPYPTVLPIAQIAAHIQNSVTEINNGLYSYNLTSGQAIWMPQEIRLEFIAIDQFQALAVVSQEGGTSTSAQTGTDTSVTTGNTSDISNQMTTHGETSNTTDGDQSEYVGYDPTAAIVSGNYNTPTLGLQAQPFPV
jgi:hypothetical protein